MVATALHRPNLEAKTMTLAEFKGKVAVQPRAAYHPPGNQWRFCWSVAMRIRFPCLGAFIVIAASLPLCAAGKTTPSALAGTEDRDADGDGLSDFQEIHKYFTDPRKRATAGRSTPDGDWDERRQFTYSIR